VGTVSDTVANQILDAICRNTSFSYAAVWVKLHTGDPGTAGTSNAATNTTRQQATFGSAAASRAISNTVLLEWTAVPATETYSWVSLWTASSGGTFLGRDDLASPIAVPAGSTFTIAIGDLDIVVP